MAITFPRRIEERRQSALRFREEGARIAFNRTHDVHVNNDDEVNYPGFSFIGNYSKGLPHDSIGDPEPVGYGILLRALESEDPGDFEEVRLAGALKLTNPQAGLAFSLEGPDPQEITLPPAPRFDSIVTAHEMGELYWMAVARDVSFINWAADAGNPASIIAQAIQSLNSEFPQFGGTTPVTVQNLFRGIYQGEQVGPYVSQFLWKGNADPRKPLGQGRSAADGYITYGPQVIDQRQWTVLGRPALGNNADYLFDVGTWKNAQNGSDFRGQDQLDTSQRRFIRNLRDGASYVHFDAVINAFYNAAWILLCEPTGNQLTSTARPCVDMEFPFNVGNPYLTASRQTGFATFGPIHVFEVLDEVLGRAIRAVWYQKWFVHRRLRPEEFGGRIDNEFNGRRDYPFHPSILTSLSAGLLAPHIAPYGSLLLPQAYPEGCPTHPAYGAGHTTGAAACATILKAFFDDTKAIESPHQANAAGTALVAYTGADAAQMTVGGELNKLAGNISLFRNAGGVHWRSDYTQSILLGEAVAIGLLQEMSITYNEDSAFFRFSRFDGTCVEIRDGEVVACP